MQAPSMAFVEADDDAMGPVPSFTPEDDKEDGFADTPLSPASPHSDPLGRPARNLPQPTLPELSDGVASCTLRTVSLNLGGRNTNPVEFVLKGDSSETASELSAVLRKAKKNLQSVKEGPRSLLPAELQLVGEILDAIYGEAMDETSQGSRARVQELLRYRTWEDVIAHARQHSPHLFNALNLQTLKLQRPSPWEDPASCREFANSAEYLAAWRDWFRGLDRSGDFWQTDAPRAAKRRAMDVPTAFAGLLLFDVMCVCSARNVVRSAWEDSMSSDEREINFRGLARFAQQLPASCHASKHAAATKFVAGAQVLFAQEALGFAEHPLVVEDFLPPFYASDGHTSVFLRKAAFEEATDITDAVAKRMTSLADTSPKGWHSSTKRLAAVFCRGSRESGGFKCCLVSLHCSRSDHTASFLEALRDVLADYDADLNVVGMDANCTSENVRDFQKKLVRSGFEVGCTPSQQQVTVAKQRTQLHTQVRKMGEVDIVHKDYIISWASSRIRRGATSYAPDLRTSYGVEQETKQCVCLPTTYWPFDHCGVATTFNPRYKCKEALASRRTFLSCALLGFMFLTLLAPLVPGARKNPYGEPGTWHFESFIGTPRTGICEAGAPCGEGWIESEGSCYLATPLMGYMDAERFCTEAGSQLVSITSEAENDFLTRSICPEDEFCWIGMRSDNSRESLWWLSGEPVGYSRLIDATIPLPIFPLSRASEFQVVMLSNLPGEITGCDNRFVPPLQKPPTSLWVLNGWSPAFCSIVSLVIMLLPRPRHFLTTVYLMMAFSTNLVWWLLRVTDFCFASTFASHTLLYFAYTMVDVGGKTQSSLVAFWIIIQRMKVLGSARAITAIFFALVNVIGIASTVQSLFIDTSTTFDGASPLILLWVALLVSIVILYLVAAAIISMDLYSTWDFLHREASAGRSSQSGGVLNSEVRAAKLHFLSVLAALVSGGGRWFGLLTMIGAWTQPNISAYWWTIYLYFFTIVVDSVTNDFCAYILAVSKMDGAVLRASGITKEVVERAREEVEQHRIAVKVLRAAPTSAEQLRHLARLEAEARASLFEGKEGDKGPFMVLQSAVRVETARIHWLMQCVRLRDMTMPVRYQYLMEVPVLEGAPRQQVPPSLAAAAQSPQGSAASAEYFDWLYAEAEGAQQVLFGEVRQLLAKFNSTPWPSDLGLAREQFPWMIWSSGADGAAGKRLQKSDVLSPGNILLHAPRRKSSGFRSQSGGALCFALEEVSEACVRIHRSGMEAAEEAPREELRACGGGAVFIPGPMKKRQRCLDKIAADYEGSVEWPAAASLTDICRCMIVLDDPYAAAVLVAHLRKNLQVVRLKNRFNEDVLESRSPGELQSMFSRSCSATTTEHTRSEIESASSFLSGDQQYRDISMNVAVTSPSGVPLICEIQVTLANLAILKCAEQQLYTIRRMRSPKELQSTYVFSKKDEVEANMAEM